MNSSGPWAGQLASKVGIYVPVEPRKRNVFVLDCPDGPKFNFAFLVDRSGLYIRYEGGHYITGMSPDAVGIMYQLYSNQNSNLSSCFFILCYKQDQSRNGNYSQN